MFDDAPGAPGIDPTWTSSAKDLVGSSFGSSRIWFTLGFGIVNEVYWPRADAPQIRDLGFIVSGPDGFWAEVKRVRSYTLELAEAGIPAATVTHVHERFTLRLRIVVDPDRDVLAIDAELTGEEGLKLYVLLAPHLGATGFDNVATVAQVFGRTVLGAEFGDVGLALTAVDRNQNAALGEASAGYVGESDGWQDFNRNGAFTWRYAKAGPGNVALTAALPNACVLHLGFGAGVDAAAVLALSSAAQPFEALLERQAALWRDWHEERSELASVTSDPQSPAGGQLHLSSMVLRAHRDKTYPGTMVASLSIPWGNSHNDRGGYHLVWPRDLVQCAGALLAIGAEADARNTLRYLIATQKSDGSWNQNQWLGGGAYWSGVQLDEAAFPVLLAASLKEREALGGVEVSDMTLKALSYIARNGPSSDQDRWEENVGVNGYTLAVALGALASAGEFLSGPDAQMAGLLADTWNERIEDWLVAKEGAHVRAYGVEGHYVRIGPTGVIADPGALRAGVKVKNRPDGGDMAASDLVSTDFLQLVRFGVRAADDPFVLSTLKVADGLLRVETPSGPAWRRYNGDGYGEHIDGAPFDGGGVGRAWPLLAGERGHYEVAAGRDARGLLEAMNAMTGPGGMIPEQVWDVEPIPDRGLYPGRPSGSAMPLAWAHAEFIKLSASISLGRPFDRPAASWRRWGGEPARADAAVFTPRCPIPSVRQGCGLWIAAPRPGVVRYGFDGWSAASEANLDPAGLGLFAKRLSSGDLTGRGRIDFTFRWLDGDAWAGEDFTVRIVA